MYLSTHPRNNPSKIVMVRSGRAALDRFFTDMGSIHENKLFFPWIKSLKSILSEIRVVASYHM